MERSAQKEDRRGPQDSSLNRWQAGMLLIGVAVVFRLHARSYDYLSDDTFIGLRYVRNLLDGNGLVFNIGDRVEGFTNLLWLLVIALPSAIGFDLVSVARGLSLVSAVLAMFAVIPLTRRLQPAPVWIALLPVLLVASNAAYACWATAGMEAPFFALCVVASLLLLDRADDRASGWIAAGVMLGLTALARPEGMLLGPVLLLVATAFEPAARRFSRIGWATLPFAGIVAAQLTWRRSYYGDWLPNTYYAKVGGGSLALIERGFDYLLAYMQDLGGWVLLVVPLIAALWRRDRLWWLVAAAFTLLAATIVYEGGDGLPMYRFVVPLVPLWAILFVGFLADAARIAAKRMTASTTPAGTIAVVVCVGLAALAGYLPNRWAPSYGLYADQKNREIPAWTEVGRWLAQNADPSDSVACVPIGAVGYYSGLELFDMVGLTDRHIARKSMALGEGMAGHEKRDGPYILSRKPTYLLLGNINVRPQRIDFDAAMFLQPPSPLIRMREWDIFTPELERDYERSVARLADGQYLHYMRRRSAAGSE